jgi:hypothetical protein
VNTKNSNESVIWHRLAACGTMLALCALCAASPAFAGIAYDAGPLDFASSGQSMWGPGSSFESTNSVFLGTQWTNRSATLGGFIGTTTPPVIGPTNPFWYAWKTCVSTINLFCGSEPNPENGQILPGTDTRTGAQATLTTSGKFGLDFGYTINSGTVDASVGFGAQATLPQTSVAQQTYFSLDTSSALSNGNIKTQSPEIGASMSAIAQLSGSVSGQACIVGQCAHGSFDLPTMNVDQPILSLDPGGLNILPGIIPPENPGDPSRPLATVPLATQGLDLEGALSATGELGFELTGPPDGSTTILDTLPEGVPALTEPVASLGFNIPNIATSADLSGGKIASSGSDSLLSANIDLTGIGGLLDDVPTEIGADLIKTSAIDVSLGFTGLDVQAGPQLSVGQNFNLNPTLMVNLAFSNPVMIAGESGPQTSWEGRWADLPEIALQETTTFTPTFWIDGELSSETSLDLGLAGTYNLLQLSGHATIDGYDAIDLTTVSLNQLLGLGDTLFSTPTIDFPVFNKTFALGGFGMVAGAPFTIDVTPSSAVAEPGTLDLFAAGAGLLLLGFRRRGRGQRGGSAS